MAQVNIASIEAAIREKKAAWVARDHQFLRLSDEQKKRRLGVILDENRLRELKELPKPDIAGVVARQLGLRIPEHRAKADKIAESSAAVGLNFSELYSQILQLIGNLIRLCPSVVDWRNRKGRNNVTSVKDQGGCGSCVSFGTIGTLESMVLIEHDVGLDLSEAELLFCGGGGCGGWWPDSAVTYLLGKGVALESCFPYQDHDMPCTVCSERDGEAIQISNHTVLSNEADRKHYLCAVGPTMCVFEVYDDFFSYSSGVYSYTTGSLAGLHCVEVIGYDNTKNCWICKNSWGAGWGDAGFFEIAYGQCGIDSTYPFWGISSTQWYK
jgi:hypothetical protein